MDNLIFAVDCLGVCTFKLIKLAIFLIGVLDKTTSTISHFTKSVRQPPMHLIRTCVCGFLAVWIRHVPDVVRYKPFHQIPLVVINRVFWYLCELVGKAGDILNQDIISSNHNFSLLLSRRQLTIWLLVLSRLRHILLNNLTWII